MDLIIPRYHVISDHELEHVSGIYKVRNVRQFRADMEFLLKYYTPISLKDLIDHLNDNVQLPKRCFLLTFDDGFRESHDIVAPILKAKGIPAVFFLITSVIDNRALTSPQKQSLLIRALDSPVIQLAEGEAKQVLNDAGVQGTDLPSRILNVAYSQREVLDRLGAILGCDFAEYAETEQPHLTTEQIKTLMRQGFDIGAHSIDHPLYSELTLDEQLYQTHESINWLSKHFQYECQSFAFPYRDTGVTKEFFQKAFANGRIQVSFGTGGMFRHFFPRNLARFTMEKTDRPARQILAREFGVTILSDYLSNRTKTP